MDFDELSKLDYVTHCSITGGDHSLETPDREETLKGLLRYLALLEELADTL